MIYLPTFKMQISCFNNRYERSLWVFFLSWDWDHHHCWMYRSTYNYYNARNDWLQIWSPICRCTSGISVPRSTKVNWSTPLLEELCEHHPFLLDKVSRFCNDVMHTWPEEENMKVFRKLWRQNDLVLYAYVGLYTFEKLQQTELNLNQMWNHKVFVTTFHGYVLMCS